jgi:carboxymethylenebutenolidase
MPGRTIRIRSRTGDGEFDCYLALPQNAEKVPAVVLASAVHGVNKDLCDLADEFASRGFIAAAPDLFWRSLPGPLAGDDKRAGERSQPRLEKIRAGETDMMDTLVEVQKLPQSNGRAAAMGFCYGGPYAILGPKRLGYAAGISCHGTRMLDYLGDLDGVTQPVCIMWGDQDHAAPADVLDAYRAGAGRMPNLELHIFPGVQHGYMMPQAKAYDAQSRAFSMQRALAILNDLRATQPRRQAS